jgi:hypothetical protein
MAQPRTIQPPVDVLRRELALWDVPHVARAVFGSEDAEHIVAMVDRFCTEHLGSGVAGYYFATASVGATHGLRLCDGRDVVLKARQPLLENPSLMLTDAMLDTVSSVMRFLSARGYSCPEPLIEARPLGRGNATLETFIDGPERGDGFEPDCRRAIARALYELLALLREVPFAIEHLRHFARDGALYPPPHSKLFDFSLPTALGPAIDAVARRARALEAHASQPVLGHADWKVEHLRFDGPRVVAVYDWDSLAYCPETELVGIAAHGFTADWGRPGVRRVPSADDIRAFVQDYEDARGRPFSAEEQRSVIGRAVYTIAYGARCALSRDPDRTAWQDDSFPSFIATHAPSLLREHER